MNPVISIILPFYNSANTLCECLDSIIEQSFADFELLMIDDGSTDQSMEVVHQYADNRIRILTNKHDFIGSLNMGIKEAKGKYIARMDADDIMFPHRLQTQFDFIESHPDIDVCGSYAESFGEIKAIIQRPVGHVDIISSMLLSNPLMHPTVMIRLATLQQSGCLYRYGYPCAEDYKLWTDLALKGCKFANIAESLLHYRISNQQVTRTSQNEMWISSAKIALEYAEGIIEQMIDQESQYGDLFNSLVELFNNELISHEAFMQTVYIVYKDFNNNIFLPLSKGDRNL